MGYLGLRWWKIDIEHYRLAADFAHATGNSEEALACAKVAWQYSNACISFNYEKIWRQELNDEELERMVRHELCHCLVHEMREWCQTESLPFEAQTAAMKHEERVVTHLEKAFGWVWNSAFEAGRNSTNGDPI